MRILHVFTFFSIPHGGGTVDVIYKLSRALMQGGHEVTVYTSDFELDQEYIDSLSGVNVQPFHSWLDLPGLHLTPGMIIEAKRKHKDFDIIHLHGTRSVQIVVLHHYAKKYNIPYILQAHGSLPTFQKQRLKKIFDTFFGYKILRDASKVIALTRTEAEQYKKMGVDEDNIEIVPNGIDLSEYENLPKRGEFRRKYSVEDDEKIILYIGRLHKSKGIDLLVKAFADLSKELGNVRLVLLGPDDGYQLALNGIIKELKIDNKVLFTGFVSNDEKVAAFVDADVFVTPSFSGFPVTFLEACACGTPIITTNNGDELDWIDDKVGYVVRYDKAILRDVIFKVLSDDGLSRKFGEEGRRLVREKFGWDRIVRTVEELYEETTSN